MLAVVVLVAVGVPAPGAAPSPSLGVLRTKLADAIRDEQRAKQLLERKPPRVETARLALRRSREILDELLKGPLPHAARYRVGLAAGQDEWIDVDLGKNDSESAAHRVYIALMHKSFAMEALHEPPATAGPQCADGVDNDKDGTTDAQFDSGCGNRKDDTEGSALGGLVRALTEDGVTVQVRGTTTGPVAEIELRAPAGNAFVTGRTPKAQHETACQIRETFLRCLMKDGAANPRHVLDVGPFRLREPLRPPAALSLSVRDFAGRRWKLPLAPQGQQVQPPPGPPKEVTQSFTVPADGTVTHTVTTRGALHLRFQNLSREFDSSRCATLFIRVTVDGTQGEEIGVIPAATVSAGGPGRASPGRHTVSVTSRVHRGACEPIQHPGGRLDVITTQ